jgi:hypothetical protein
MGIANLVFASPHVLIPADAFAEFGVYPLPQSERKRKIIVPFDTGLRMKALASWSGFARRS